MQTLRTFARWVDEQTETLATGVRVVRESLSGGLSFDFGASTRFIARMREAGAVTPQTAQRVHLATSAEERQFARFRELGLVREPSPGRYYLDERAVARAQREFGQ